MSIPPEKLEQFKTWLPFVEEQRAMADICGLTLDQALVMQLHAEVQQLRRLIRDGQNAQAKLGEEAMKHMRECGDDDEDWKQPDAD